MFTHSPQLNLLELHCASLNNKWLISHPYRKSTRPHKPKHYDRSMFFFKLTNHLYAQHLKQLNIIIYRCTFSNKARPYFLYAIITCYWLAHRQKWISKATKKRMLFWAGKQWVKSMQATIVQNHCEGNSKSLNVTKINCNGPFLLMIYFSLITLGYFPDLCFSFNITVSNALSYKHNACIESRIW